MFKISRQEQVLELIKEKREVTLDDLSRYMNTSTSTIRRDLQELNKKYPIIITRGGVIYNEKLSVVDNNICNENMIKIGEKAADLIREGETLIVDAGCTNYAMALALSKRDIKNITVITINIDVVNVLRKRIPDINIIVVGGEYRGYYRSLVGPISEEIVKDIKADKAFVGAAGISEKGIYTTLLGEINLRRYIINSSPEVILVADSTKFNNNSGFLITSFAPIKKIVTDYVPENFIEIFRENNIEIILA